MSKTGKGVKPVKPIVMTTDQKIGRLIQYLEEIQDPGIAWALTIYREPPAFPKKTASTRRFATTPEQYMYLADAMEQNVANLRAIGFEEKFGKREPGRDEPVQPPLDLLSDRWLERDGDDGG